MCNKCNKNSITYSDIYNEAYISYRQENLNKWILTFLKKMDKTCPRYRIHARKLLHTALTSQSIFHSVKDNNSISQLLQKEKKITSIQSNIFSRKIQKHAIKYLHKPNGYIFKKSLKELQTFMFFE